MTRGTLISPSSAHNDASSSDEERYDGGNALSSLGIPHVNITQPPNGLLRYALPNLLAFNREDSRSPEHETTII